MKTTHREEAVYAAVKMGLLHVREDGSVWRMKYRRKSRWDGKVTITAAKSPARVDAACGLGYRQVKIMMDGRQVTCLAHRLVWLHFNGPIPTGMQINHKDGNKSNNALANLETCSASNNMKHANKVGLASQKGSRNNHSKLSPMDVEAIRRSYAAGRETQSSIAARYAISHQAVSKIVRGDRMPGELGPTADYAHRRRHATQRDAKGRFLS